MKSKRTFIDYSTFIREPLSEKEKGLAESAIQKVSEFRKRHNVKIELLESPHKENAFEDELSEEDLKAAIKEFHRLKNK